MGEARNRKLRRALAAQIPPGGRTMLPNLEPIRHVPKIRQFDAVNVDKAAFDAEYAAHLERYQDQRPTERQFLEAIIETGLERMRQEREQLAVAAEARTRLVQPVAVMPRGIVEAAKRLESMRG